MVEPKKFEDLEPFVPLQVIIGDYNFESSVKRFKSLVQKSQILAECKNRKQYEKPSDKKRRKCREAQERQRIIEHRERLMATGEWDKRQKRREQKKIEKLLKKQQMKENNE